MSPEIKKLRTIARGWGGDIVEVSETHFQERFRHQRRYRLSNIPDKRFKHFYECPFSSEHLGIHPPTRRVLFAESHYPYLWVEMVHELGHLFATKDPVMEAEEFNWFGWEYCLARQVGDAQDWMDKNDSYGLGMSGKDSFGCLNPEEQKDLLRGRIKTGQLQGIITDTEQAISIWQ